jgi:hypothetical protein
MFIGSIPHLFGDCTASIKLRTHALLLRTLSSEDVCRDWLLDLSLTKQDLVLSFLIARLDLDYLTACYNVSKSMILIIFKVVIIINDFFFHLNHNQIKVIMIKS